jgi:hypothetical protein
MERLTKFEETGERLLPPPPMYDLDPTRAYSRKTEQSRRGHSSESRKAFSVSAGCTWVVVCFGSCGLYIGFGLCSSDAHG